MVYLLGKLFFYRKAVFVSQSVIWGVFWRLCWDCNLRSCMKLWFGETKTVFTLNTFCSAFLLLFSLEGFCQVLFGSKIGNFSSNSKHKQSWRKKRTAWVVHAADGFPEESDRYRKQQERKKQWSLTCNKKRSLYSCLHASPLCKVMVENTGFLRSSSDHIKNSLLSHLVCCQRQWLWIPYFYRKMVFIFLNFPLWARNYI